MTVEQHRYRLLRWAPWVLLAWAVGYGAVRVRFATGHRPRFAPMPDDLVFAGWWPVAMCAAAGVAAIVVLAVRDAKPAPILLWTLSGVTLLANPILLLDAVGWPLAGLGVPLNPASSASRLGLFAGSVLLAVTARAYHRRTVGGCAHCGRTGPSRVVDRTPRWAFAAAYLAVVGCLVRIGAQLALGFDDLMYRGGAALLVFEGGFLMAGILLPTALVHRFGRVWPGWVLPLAGRRVPRWLVLGPGFFIGGGLSVYFGFNFVELIGNLITGAPDGLRDAYGAGFVWTAIPGYLVWGVGVLVASIARFRATRPICRWCGW